MSKKNVRRRGLISRFFEPFSTADSADAYARQGYWLIGLPVVGFALVFIWWVGLATTPLDRLWTPVAFFPKLVAKATGISDEISTLTIPLFLVTLYLLLGFGEVLSESTGKPTIKIGSFLANRFFGLLSWLIDCGERSIKNRKGSAIAILVLTSVTVVIGSLKISQFRTSTKLRDQTTNWVGLADTLVSTTTLSRDEPEQYRLVGKLESAIGSEDSRMTPDAPSILSELLALVYTEDGPKDDLAWTSHVSKVMPFVEKLLSASNAYDQSDLVAIRAVALSHIFAGRLYIRSAEDAQITGGEVDERCLSLLAKAQEHFYNVKQLLGPVDAPWKARQFANATNGLGLIYANLSRILYHEPKRVLPEVFANVCPDVMTCTAEATNAFESAGKGFEDCSYEAKRRRNNLTELLAVVGVNYEVASDPSIRSRISKNLDASNLASQLESSANEMLACNRDQPLIIDTLATASYAYAAAARLRLLTNQNAEEDVVSSAYFLRLAYNVDEKNNISTWYLSPYCFLASPSSIDASMFSSSELVQKFTSELERPILGLDTLRWTILVNKVKGNGKCRK